MSDTRPPEPGGEDRGPVEPAEEARLRDALRREAGRIDPADRFAEITTRLPGRRRYLWPVAGVVLAAVVLVVGALVAVPLLQPSQHRAEPGINPGGAVSTPAVPAPSALETPKATTTASATPGGLPTPGAEASEEAPPPPTVPVYYLGLSVKHTENGKETIQHRLFREFHAYEPGGAELPTDKVALAIESMADQAPLDPDYTTAWISLGAVTVTDDHGQLAIDLTDFPATLPEGVTATEAMQQLVWTATAAYQDILPVVVTVDGKTSAPWGAKLLGKPLTRDAAYHAPVWILDPAMDQHDKAGTVTISGVSTAFEGTVQWRITKAGTDKEVAHGHTMGGANGKFATFKFSTDLKKGSYTVTVYVPDQSGRFEMTDFDSKTWHVD